MKRFFRDESGASLVFTALIMVVLIGFTALAVDGGSLYFNHTRLQDTADAAALAGAQDLPNESTATSTAKDYAVLNGAEESNTTVTTPYNGDSTKIEVICTKNVHHSFARVLGFTDTDVSARAVAWKNSQWSGEALPFVNLGDDYEENPEIVIWDKEAPGDYGSIEKDAYEIINEDDPDTLYFKVDYENGLMITKGVVATVKQEIGYIYEQHQPDKPIYLLSLKNDVINSGLVKLSDGSYRALSKLKNKDVLDISQLVLLKCTFDAYDESAKKLDFTVLDVFDIANNEFPPDYVNPEGGGSSTLVE